MLLVVIELCIAKGLFGLMKIWKYTMVGLLAFVLAGCGQQLSTTKTSYGRDGLVAIVKGTAAVWIASVIQVMPEKAVCQSIQARLWSMCPLAMWLKR